MYSASATALAAMAPENPATNDVHPLRNPVSGPKASRRYTYSPPAFGRSAASSAYAMAPAKASAPPSEPDQQDAPRTRDELRDDDRREEDATADDVRHDNGGCVDRTETAVQRSGGVGRHAREAVTARSGGARPGTRRCSVHCVEPYFAKTWARASTNCLFASICCRGLGAGVAKLRLDAQHLRRRARSQTLGPGDTQEAAAPLLVLTHAPEDHVALQRGDGLAAERSST